MAKERYRISRADTAFIGRFLLRRETGGNVTAVADSWHTLMHAAHSRRQVTEEIATVAAMVSIGSAIFYRWAWTLDPLF